MTSQHTEHIPASLPCAVTSASHQSQRYPRRSYSPQDESERPADVAVIGPGPHRKSTKEAKPIWYLAPPSGPSCISPPSYCKLSTVRFHASWGPFMLSNRADFHHAAHGRGPKMSRPFRGLPWLADTDAFVLLYGVLSYWCRGTLSFSRERDRAAFSTVRPDRKREKPGTGALGLSCPCCTPDRSHHLNLTSPH